MRYLFLLTLATVVLTGCGGFNYAKHYADQGYYSANPDFSEALNVARATGLTECSNSECKPLRDVSRADLPASMQGKTNIQLASSVMDALVIGQGVGQVAGVVSVVSGVGQVAGGLLTLGTFLTGPSPRDAPVTQAWILAWMPDSKATTSEQAVAQMRSIIRNAMPEQFDGGTAEFDNTFDGGTNVRLYDEQDCQSPYYCGVHIRVQEPYKSEQSPSWSAGHGAAYVWQNWKRGSNTDGTYHHIRIHFNRRNPAARDPYKQLPLAKSIDRRAFLIEMSKGLPAWAYIYLPPTERHNFPAMLNQGKLLLFIEPARNSKRQSF